MPTALQVGKYSFVFFSSDQREPPHIHVKNERRIAKFWLEPISLAKNKGFRDHEINEISKIIQQHKNLLIEAWHDHFGT